jgi:hypothetical protein
MEQYQEEVLPYHDEHNFEVNFVESEPGKVVGWELYLKDNRK